MGIKSLVVAKMSAKDLHKVTIIHKMDPYVVVSVSDNHRQQTRVHKNGGTSPKWNSLLTFPIDEAHTSLLTLVFEIMTERTYGGKKEVGRVEVQIAELLEKQGDGKPKQMSRSVSLPSGKTQGVLEFTYEFGEELPGGCGNTPAPEQGPTQKGRGQALIRVARKTAVWATGTVVEGVAGEFAGDLINGSDGSDTEDK